jgi:2-amino-4-hydroxy-6-hydroxymethyldihydropteridine diphosphokinase
MGAAARPGASPPPGGRVAVYVAAGSNIEPQRHLKAALALLRAEFPDLRASRAYANAAAGFAGDDFINLVVGFTTELPLATLLERLHAVEIACGRPRAAPRWAPRSMDLDVLLYGDAVGNFLDTELPRPDLPRRAYMLGPLAELAPEVVHPTLGVPVGELWRRFDQAAHPLRRVSLDGARADDARGA